jgi:hypothetical protein
MINFLYFVKFLMTSQISFRFHALPELSQHRPSCSLENQVGLKLQTYVNECSNSINQLIIDHAFYFRTILRHIKLVSHYSETSADRENLRGPGQIFPSPGRRITLLFLSLTQLDLSSTAVEVV